MTLEQVPMHRLSGYITTNGICGLALDRLPNGQIVAAEVRRDEEGEHRTPYVDLAGEPANVVRALAERCGLPILAGKAATREEIAMWYSHCQKQEARRQLAGSIRDERTEERSREAQRVKA